MKVPVIATLLLACSAMPARSRCQESDAAPTDELAGVWRGNSVCTVKDSPCHDEVNVYRISTIPSKPTKFLVSADKIVDGKEEVMGTGEWTYDQGTHSLVYEFPRGVFRLKISGTRIAGELTLPDGTLYRRIYLEKEK